MHEEALTTELPRAARRATRRPAITAVAGALLLGALAAALEDAAAAVTLSLLGAGVVLALFVLVPRAAAAIRRHPVLLAGVVAGRHRRSRSSSASATSATAATSTG